VTSPSADSLKMQIDSAAALTFGAWLHCGHE
jgi:hypothetical protein